MVLFPAFDGTRRLIPVFKRERHSAPFWSTWTEPTASFWKPWFNQLHSLLDCVWNVMAHAQKPDFVFRRNERVHLNRRGHQFSRLLAGEVCASAVVMLGTPCFEVVCRVLATHSIRHFLLHFPSLASPCATTFQLDSTSKCYIGLQSHLRSKFPSRETKVTLFPYVWYFLLWNMGHFKDNKKRHNSFFKGEL